MDPWPFESRLACFFHEIPWSKATSASSPPPFSMRAADAWWLAPGGKGRSHGSSKFFWMCRASIFIPRCQTLTCQFARVVKGVDLRSTTRKCAWVRTPQLTSGSPRMWPLGLLNRVLLASSARYLGPRPRGQVRIQLPPACVQQMCGGLPPAVKAGAMAVASSSGCAGRSYVFQDARFAHVSLPECQWGGLKIHYT